jgi:hypothetical protein
MKSTRRTAVFVGVLFLTATVTFMMGSGLIRSFFVGDGPNRTSLTMGVLLEIACGAAVVGIGVLMLPILRMFNKRLALGYVAFRAIECAVIIGGGMYMLFLLRQVWKYEMILFLFTGLGGLIFSCLLYQSQLVPRVLSVLGTIGYAVLLAGVSLNMLGYVDTNTGAGMLLYLPGGLFELFLPVWLFVRGFNASATASRPPRQT